MIVYLQLLLSFMKIGVLGFGGGMAIISLIQNEVEHYGWMSNTEFVDILAISQMTPGPIGINCATYVGYTATGTVFGSLVATIAIMIPSLVIMLILSRLYLKISGKWSGNKIYQWTMMVIRALVIGLIAHAAIKLISPETFIDWWSWVLFALVFIGVVAFKLHPILLISLAGVAGLVIYLPSCKTLSATPSTEEIELRHEAQVDSVLSTMTTHEKVGQLFVVTTGHYGSQTNLALIDSLAKNDGLGGVIVMDDSLARGRERLNHLQNLARIPLLVCVDGEWGPSMRYAEFPFFPRQMQLGALPNDSLIYLMGRAVGEQCLLAGIQANFAPVVDININPRNPVINTRSFGEDREKVATYGSAYMRGMQDAGIFACAKHFPGHGDTEVDSHKALPTLPFSRERLDSIELYPFRRLIDDGVAMVMMGHLNIPALDSNVSSVSYPIVTGLLKEEMQFKGVVVTDGLGMKGVAEGRTPEEVAVMAYKAGVDILLMPRDARASMRAVEACVESGEVSMEDLDSRVRKILRLKAKAGMLENDYQKLIDVPALLEAVNRPQDSVLIERMAEQSVTLCEGSKVQQLDSIRSKKIAYVGYRAEWKVLRRAYGEREGLTGFGSTSGILRDSTTVMLHSLMDDSLHIDYYPLPIECSTGQLKACREKLRGYDLVIVGVHDQSGRPNRNLINDSHKSLLDHWATEQPMALVFFGNPYALMNLPFADKCQTVIIGYSDTPANERAAAGILTGKLPALGTLPVSW